MAPIPLDLETAEAGCGLPPVWLLAGEGYECAPDWREIDWTGANTDLCDDVTARGLVAQLATWVGDDGRALGYWLRWDDRATWGLMSARSQVPLAYFTTDPSTRSFHIPGVGRMSAPLPAEGSLPARRALARICQWIGLCEIAVKHEEFNRCGHRLPDIDDGQLLWGDLVLPLAAPHPLLTTEA